MAVSMTSLMTAPDCYLPSGVDFLSVRDRRVRFSELDDSSSADGTSSQAESPTGANVVGTPCVRFGMASDKGKRESMEDACVAQTDLKALNCLSELPELSAVFGVFDGHFGAEAATFTSERIVQNIVQHASFPSDIETALKEAFLLTDEQYLQSCKARQEEEDAGTTALVAVVWGSKIFHANAGDCRAVVCRRGRSVDLTSDQKPDRPSEKLRIEERGGFVCGEGRLCGELTVARAIGDHHLRDHNGRDLKGRNGPLTAEPEIGVHELLPEDEFLLIGCDGLWDVLSSQRAVEYARQHLRLHNNPQACCEDLVSRALNMHTSDNVSVMLVCFSCAPPPRRNFRNSFGRSLSRDGLSTLAQALNVSTHTH